MKITTFYVCKHRVRACVCVCVCVCVLLTYELHLFNQVNRTINETKVRTKSWRQWIMSATYGWIAPFQPRQSPPVQSPQCPIRLFAVNAWGVHTCLEVWASQCMRCVYMFGSVSKSMHEVCVHVWKCEQVRVVKRCMNSAVSAVSNSTVLFNAYWVCMNVFKCEQVRVVWKSWTVQSPPCPIRLLASITSCRACMFVSFRGMCEHTKNNNPSSNTYLRSTPSPPARPKRRRLWRNDTRASLVPTVFSQQNLQNCMR
jgi:hypothetical protein